MMKDSDPKWSAVVIVDHFTDVSSAAKILTVCLEQIADNPPDLIPRLHWLITSVRAEMERIGEDGTFKARRVRDYLYQFEPGEGDECDRPAGAADCE